MSAFRKLRARTLYRTVVKSDGEYSYSSSALASCCRLSMKEHMVGHIYCSGHFATPPEHFFLGWRPCGHSLPATRYESPLTILWRPSTGYGTLLRTCGDPLQTPSWCRLHNIPFGEGKISTCDVSPLFPILLWMVGDGGPHLELEQSKSA